jgi:signal transduction histidine kinase
MELGDLAATLIRGLDSIVEFGDVRELLKAMVERFGSGCSGVILWESADGYRDIPPRRLFAQGQHMSGSQAPPFYELPMSSISAKAIVGGKSVSHARLAGKWQVDVNHPEALDRLGIEAFATVPMQLHGGTKGQYDSALTFYRVDRPFSMEEIDALAIIGSWFPSLYTVVLKRVSLSLLTAVQEVLGHGHYPAHESAGDPAAERLARDTMSKVVGIIKQRFRCLEVSIYAGDPTSDPPSFNRMASEWPWRAPEANSYTPGGGGTGWVLRNGVPLQLLDLLHYEDDSRYYARKYPGMLWKGAFDVAGQARDLLGLQPGDQLPPLSYVCVPIIHNNRVFGAIRCCVQQMGPYYFDDDLTQALMSVADLAGDWWVHWLDEQRQSQEHRSLLYLLSSLSRSNQEALRQLQSPQKDSSAIINGVLDACTEVVPEVDVLQVWTRNGDRNEAVLVGESRSVPGGNRRKPPFVTLEAALPDGRKNALAAVWNSTEAKEFDSTTGFGLPDCKTCRHFAAAPIVVDDKTHGVLVLLSHGASKGAKSFLVPASFIARQLAVYETLRRQFQDLREKDRLQGSLLLDFQHQIRSPVNMICAYAETLLSNPVNYSPETLRTMMEASRRANSVASNLQLFVQLAQEIPPQALLEKVRPSYVFQNLERAASYLYSRKALGKELKFDVDPGWRTNMRPFIATLDRLDLVFDNLLDNAVKYSYHGTTVRIFGVAPPNQPDVYIAFQNTGLRIAPGEVAYLMERGVRGEEAKRVHPEGTGIGLWMVSQVLKSMKGHLEVIPTNNHGVNEFRVWLKRAQ